MGSSLCCSYVFMPCFPPIIACESEERDCADFGSYRALRGAHHVRLLGSFFPVFFADHGPSRGSAQKISKISRGESGRVRRFFKSHGSGQEVFRCHGSRQEVFRCHGSGWVGSARGTLIRPDPRENIRSVNGPDFLFHWDTFLAYFLEGGATTLMFFFPLELFLF